jgi:hypothetical protein
MVIRRDFQALPRAGWTSCLLAHIKPSVYDLPLEGLAAGERSLDCALEQGPKGLLTVEALRLTKTQSIH